MRFTLERYRAFPYVAWTIVAVAVYFTYTMATHTAETIASLEDHTAHTKTTLEAFTTTHEQTRP